MSAVASVEKDSNKVVTVTAHCGQGEKTKEISYTDTKVIGNGSFGVVYQARLCETNEIVAVKKVLQDRRFKNRELQIMRQLDHQNIVQLKYFFHLVGERKDDVYLNLVLEFVPETVYRVARRYNHQKATIPIIFVKLYMYQLLRSLAYIHHKGICHRDIKPQNLLLDPQSGVLKLCDFGSAKVLVRGEPNVSYICSRYYRAPELIFGAVEYTCQIDIWSSGCVLAELLLGQPIFPGESGVDQLVEIIKVLGTPTREQIVGMNPDYGDFSFPQIRPHPWSKVFRPRVPQDAIQLTAELLDYIPGKRLKPLEALMHSFFDELRAEDTRLPNGRPLPPLFNFTPYELSMSDDVRKLIPQTARGPADPRADGEAKPAVTSPTGTETQQPQPSQVTSGDEIAPPVVVVDPQVKTTSEGSVPAPETTDKNNNNNNNSSCADAPLDKHASPTQPTDCNPAEDSSQSTTAS